MAREEGIDPQQTPSLIDSEKMRVDVALEFHGDDRCSVSNALCGFITHQ